ncbi:MAG: phosphoheptose isomerase [Gammaproteobacteria bacterium RIFCSPHIGHO2_12_FULL_41_15]|nr:MAG: phosphoheptose isomerase [Gammaproteobacteria bacterium RIFCSPHIGHO2_12_FULL_41_15]
MSTHFITQAIQASIQVKDRILSSPTLLNQIQKINAICISTYKNRRKILIAGNGGSAADAQHMAAELVVRYEVNRPGLPAIALTTDSSILTACANDYCYEDIFKRQLEALAVEGDVFIGISTSGGSANILKALATAKKMGVTTIGLTGENGGKMQPFCDQCFCAPSTVTARVQEAHILVAHIICAAIEQSVLVNETVM